MSKEKFNIPQPSLWPYITYSLKLTARPRNGGGNMFRHQMETLAILLEYGYTDPIILKASLIHDLVEDGDIIGLTAFDEILRIDEDGKQVLELVKEVSRRVIKGENEAKSEFLLRIMLHGSKLAKILKLADRISNLTGLSNCDDPVFIKKYIVETEAYILPYSDAINPEMCSELKHWIKKLT